MTLYPRIDFTLSVQYEMDSKPHDYQHCDEDMLEVLLQRIKDMNVEPGTRNRAISYSVIRINSTIIDRGVF